MSWIFFRFGLIRRFAPVPSNEGRWRVLRLVSHADCESRLRIPLVRLFFLAEGDKRGFQGCFHRCMV